MSLDLYDGVDLVLLTAGYWLADLLTRRDGALRALAPLGLRTTRLLAILLAVPALLIATQAPWSWADIPGGVPLSVLALSLVVMLTWKATTKDFDPVFGTGDAPDRLLLLGLAIASFFSPAYLPVVALLLSNPFALWEHHATLPMRLLLVTTTWSVLHGLAQALGLPLLFADATALTFLVLVIQISHYIITALAKIWLGPKWYSWMLDNHVHHLGATAYSWGWARWMPWATWRKVIGVVKKSEKPMQAYAFGIELLAPLALLHPWSAIAFSLGWAGFHLGVFAVSGLLFWDWILADLAIAALIPLLPETVAAQVFGPWQALLGCVFLVAFPLRHKLWAPIPLGWWDTPFTQRIHWHAHGRSGTVYAVTNEFMCPNERLYGKVHACFLAPDKGITYHLGEVWKRDLRDAIRNAGPDLAELAKVREIYGIQPRDAALASNHVAYLGRFFHAINHGARKQVFPRFLRWLKAPGDQLFYWNELPRFTAQEPVDKITLHYREEYFDGERLVRLRDEQVLVVPIDESCAKVPCRPEPTPKQIDDLLLSHAAGKIIDLPGFGDGYVGVDDGKVRDDLAAATGPSTEPPA